MVLDFLRSKLYVACLGIGFIGGLGSCYYYHQYLSGQQSLHREKQKDKQEQVTSTTSISHEARILALQASFSNLEKEYAKLKEQKKLVTPDCGLTLDAARLWSRSNQGLPPNTSTTTSEASEAINTRATVGNGASIPIDFAIRNKLEWDNYYNQVEEKLDSIIEWDHKTWH